MAVMPGVSWRPLANASKTRMAAFDIICIHTMVGGLDGTDGYFRKLTNGVNSHFGTGGDGRIYQWVDTAFRSGANANGNHHIISIENADIGPEFPKWNTSDGGAVPAFSGAQIEANARIIAWACATHGIPCQLIPDARPGRRGVGFHRQGVPGYMVAGAEKWSSAAGKVCPGNRRIAQIPQIIARAQQILNGDDDMPEYHQWSKEGRDFMLADFRDSILLPALNDYFGRELDSTVHHGSDKDVPVGHIVSGHKFAKAAYDLLTTGSDGGAGKMVGGGTAGGQSVSVDATAVAAALAGNQNFLTAVGEAVAASMDRRARDGDPATGPVS